MYISASIAAAILLTPALGSLYAHDTYGSLYARDLDARDAYYEAIYAREASPKGGSHPDHVGQAINALPGTLNGIGTVVQAGQGFFPQNSHRRRNAYASAAHHTEAHVTQHAVAGHPASQHKEKGHALGQVMGHADEIGDGLGTVSNLVGGATGLVQSVQGLRSTFGNGASSNGMNGAQQNQRRSIYADPDIYVRDIDLDERDFDNLYERDLEDALYERDIDLGERDFDELYERDLEDSLYERDLEGLDERDLAGLSERDIFELYERGFEAGLEDLYD